MRKISLLLVLLLWSSVNAGARNLEALEKARSFQQWLEERKTDWAKREIAKNEKGYLLLDNTPVDRRDLKKMLSLSPEKLVEEIRSRGIEIHVLCDQKKRQTFKSFCSKNFNWPGFQKNKGLQGQFKPLNNAILLRSSALKGSLVHEYLHYLQYANESKVFGKRYKKERVDVEKELVEEMDAVIAASQKNKVRPQLQKDLMGRMLALSNELRSFGKWQDLIDERGIFLLYLNHGQDFGLSAEDKALALKNIRFIHAREDLKRMIPESELERWRSEDASQKPSYLSVVEEIIREIRPEPDLSKVESFLNALPPPPKGNLEAKAKALAKHIFEKVGIKADSSYASRKNKDNVLPDSVLTSKRGHCVGLSALYLLAFEKWGMRAALSRTPSHVFVTACEEKKCVYIETLKKGALVSRDFYFKNGNLTKAQAQNGQYLQSDVDPGRLKSSLYLGLGYIAASADQNGLAEVLYKKAVDSDRSFALAYSNLSALYGESSRPIQAKVYAEISLRVDPAHIPGLVNKSLLLWNKGKEKQALDLLSKAQEVNPFSAEIYKVRADMMVQKKNIRKSLENQVMLSSLQPGNCSSHKKVLDLSKKLDGNVLAKEVQKVRDTHSARCR